MGDLERVFGWVQEPTQGRWFTSADKNSFVRFWPGEHREILFQHQDNGWVIALAKGDKGKFTMCSPYFKTTRQAKEWADNRDMYELDDLEDLVASWM